MTVTINIAPGQVDSRAHFVKEIKKSIQKGEKRRIFYLVPNHVKFDGEVDVLSRLARENGLAKTASYAQSQVQVYSLSRLAWRLLEDEGLTQPPIIGAAGLFVMISEILAEEKASLPIFARMAAKKGFVEKLVAQLTELRASRVTPEDLLNIVNQLDTSSEQQALTANALQQKLRDLSVVADDFNSRIDGQYLLAQEVLPYFVAQMADADLSDAVFYFDGFTGFTAAEWSVVKLLVDKAEVHVALLGDVDAQDPLKSLSAGSVFEKPLETARTIQKLAKTSKKELQITVLDEGDASVQPNTRTHLLRAWEKLGAYQPYEANADEQRNTQLKAFVAANAVTELEEVARRIREDLRLNPGLHLRDILVLARDLGPYSQHLPAVMADFDLAYFLDNDVRMGNHPLVELTTTLLDNPGRLYQKDKILTILKTGYLRPVVNGQLMDDEPYFEMVAQLENYLDGHRVSKRLWQDDSKGFVLFDLPVDEESTAQRQDDQVNQNISRLKVFVHQLLDELAERFEGAENIEAAARRLMDFLQERRLPEAVLNQRDQLVAADQLIKSQQVEEVWQLFVNILDQLVQVAGERPFSRQTFLQGLQAGFAGGTFSGIPNQLDQLTISEAGIVQSQQYKKLYFIGATRSALPAQVNNKSLLSDQDRLLVQPALAEQEEPRYLQETAKQQMGTENLVFYNALQAASDGVTISYPLLDQDGNVNEASPYLTRLTNAFDQEIEPVATSAKNEAELATRYAGTAQATLSQLVKLPEIEQEGDGFAQIRQALNDAGFQEQADRVLASRHYANQPERLTIEMAKRLFHGPLVLSISQVESFYRNPYEYFLRYGLRLKEKPTVEIDARIEGTVYHALFEKAVDQVIQQNGRLADLDDGSIERQVEASLDALTAEVAFSELTEEGQGQSQARFMKERAVKVLQQLRDVARLNNQSRPTRVEAPFGFPGSDLPMVAVGHGPAAVHLRGKVDRFDRQEDSGDFGTIVDYKLNGKKFDYRDAANGLELQLLTYWQAVNENAKKMGLAENGQVGGAFFAPINQQKINFADFHGAIDELLAGQLPAQKQQLAGLALADDEYLDDLDRLEASDKSTAYNLARKKDGQLTAASDTIDKGDLELLMAHNQRLILAAASKIATGHFALSPVQQSLQYSPYQDVMRFDRALGDRYQEPDYTGGKKQILERLRQENEAMAPSDDLTDQGQQKPEQQGGGKTDD